MTSTTGVYGKFPDYYYKPGNLFGAYLGGTVPRESWDLRKEREVMGGGDGATGIGAPIWRGKAPRPTVRAASPSVARRQPAAPKKPDPVAQLRRLVPATVIAQHLHKHGVQLRPGEDVHAVYWTRFLSLLPPDQRAAAVMRLQAVVENAARDMERRLASGAVATRRSKRKRAKRARRSQPSGVGSKTARSAAPALPLTCALCGQMLSETERARCARRADVYVNSAYCTTHADQIEALFRSRGR